VLERLKAGDRVLLSGTIFTARDLAHKRFLEAIKQGGCPPFDVNGQIIYYCGPTPPQPGRTIGACGPTTSSRMDQYTPALLALGLKGMIGKGKRSKEVKDLIKSSRAVYFGATGGAGALISRCVVSFKIVAYEELGPEAVYKMEVRDMPLFVINDIYGNDLYEEGPLLYME
jgi:fumarate hydratase subunit beta